MAARRAAGGAWAVRADRCRGSRGVIFLECWLITCSRFYPRCQFQYKQALGEHVLAAWRRDTIFGKAPLKAPEAFRRHSSVACPYGCLRTQPPPHRH